MFTFAAFSLLELATLIAFSIALLIGISFDRRGSDEPKWVIFIVGFVITGSVLWGHWTLGELFAAVTSSSFWLQVGFYASLGLAWSLVEFVMDVRRSKRFYADAWARYLTSKATFYEDTPTGRATVNLQVADALRDGSTANLKTEDGKLVFKRAREVIDTFANHHGKSSSQIINVKADLDLLEIQPRINRGALTDNVAAWTFFWPIYALNLIVGDLLTEVFRTIADLFANVFGRLVKLSFSNVFKF